MQFIYIDESGLGTEPIAVMVGIIADSHRMRITKEHWNNLLCKLSSIVKQEIDEIHTRDFYSGNSPWRDLNGKQRSEIIEEIFYWLQERRHSIVYTAVNKELFFKTFNNEPYYIDIKTLWRFMALHISLAIQKRYQGASRGNKRTINLSGHCTLIFDNENREEKRFTDLLLKAPDWTDTYYDRKLHQEKFSQIVDVPHFVDSKDVGLIQLADFMCFFMRRYIELNMGLSKPDYIDEIDKVNRWVNIIFGESISKSNIFPSRGRCCCSDLFYRYAPNIIFTS
ncbi:MAG: hypothetical protein CVU43_01195 [Chloroflexi bacterium HGW-Chloroflexi-5]|jgi:hypothetical protein|nr:MAG: hypothetical protein CVU43_01195 [Chloroflexi bacterium HGW-Chloroflexi-5]